MQGINFPLCTVLILTLAGLILVGGSIVSVTVTAEQNPAPTPPPPAASAAVPTPSPTPPATPSSIVTVKDVYRYGQAKEKGGRSSAGLGDTIVVSVRGLQSLTDEAKCLDTNKTKKQNCQEQEIALYLDGRKIEGIIPESGAPRPEHEILQFHLQRDVDKNDEVWADLLGAPVPGGRFFKRATSVSVGLENAYAEPTEVTGEKFNLIRIHKARFWLCLGGLLALLYYILKLAKTSDIVRDAGPPLQGNKRKPFSLARCQMAFWFFWIISSFLFIWLITGAHDIITASTLGLMGIGAGTALGAVVIDAGKREDASSKLGSLKAEELTLNNDITAIESKINATPAPTDLSQLKKTRMERTRLNLVNQQISELTQAAGPFESEGFFKDILSDATGVSFHRFQMLVWTIVLGFLFIYSVWSRLSMPEFSASLLALQGISAGTYLGFKIPEKQVG